MPKVNSYDYTTIPLGGNIPLSLVILTGGESLQYNGGLSRPAGQVNKLFRIPYFEKLKISRKAAKTAKKNEI